MPGNDWREGVVGERRPLPQAPNPAGTTIASRLGRITNGESPNLIRLALLLLLGIAFVTTGAEAVAAEGPYSSPVLQAAANPVILSSCRRVG